VEGLGKVETINLMAVLGIQSLARAIELVGDMEQYAKLSFFRRGIQPV